MITQPEAPHPVAAAVAVVVHDGRVLLIRRRNPPDQGLWGFPGGKIAFGESITAAAIRELYEETGVSAVAENILTAFDVIHPRRPAAAPSHYVLVAVRCRWQAGTPVAGDDAVEAAWFTPAMIDDLEAVSSYQVAELAALAMAP